jgi:hypothetical protein
MQYPYRLLREEQQVTRQQYPQWRRVRHARSLWVTALNLWLHRPFQC